MKLRFKQRWLKFSPQFLLVFLNISLEGENAHSLSELIYPASSEPHTWARTTLITAKSIARAAR